VILVISILLVVSIIRSRDDPYKIISKYDKKKDKYMSKPHAASAGRSSPKEEKEVSKPKNAGYQTVDEVKSTGSQKGKTTAPVVKKATPINFSKLTSEDTAIRIPKKVSEISEIEKPESLTMNKFFKNVEKNLKKNPTGGK
jgi:hypothetical protein